MPLAPPSRAWRHPGAFPVVPRREPASRWHRLRHWLQHRPGCPSCGHPGQVQEPLGTRQRCTRPAHCAAEPAGTWPVKGAVGLRGSQGSTAALRQASAAWRGPLRPPNPAAGPCRTRKRCCRALQGSPRVLHGCAGFAPGAAGPCSASTWRCKAMQDLQTVLQDCAALAPRVVGPCRTSSQHCRATQDPQTALQGHEALAPSAVGHAGPADSAAGQCRTHSWCCRAVQDLRAVLQGHPCKTRMCCCGAVQDLHPALQGHVALAPGAAGHAGPADSAAGPCEARTRRCRSRRDSHTVQQSCARLAPALQGSAGSSPGTKPEPTATAQHRGRGAASRLASFTTWQSWAPRCPPPWPPCARSAPCAAHTDKRGLRNPGSTRRGGEMGGPQGRPPACPRHCRSQHLSAPLSTPGGHRRGSLPISQHPAPSGRWPLPARGSPAPFTVREETATGRRPS